MDTGPSNQKREVNAEVGRRFDAYLGRLSCFLEAEERTDEEKLRLGHLLKVLTHLRPGLVQCYDLADFPRTNNEMERMIRAIKMQYRRISGRKNWNSYLLRYGCCVAYQACWRCVRRETRQCHQEQLNRFRFRHRPLESLASVERRWEQTTSTGILPQSLRGPGRVFDF